MDGKLDGYVDTHFHAMQMSERGIDPERAVSEALESGMAFAIDIGVHPNEFEPRQSIVLSSMIHRTSGIAPIFAGDDNEPAIDRLRAQIVSGGVVAVGEIGLDWFRDYATHELQQVLFERQLQLADEHDLPVVIHNRDADDFVVSILRNFMPRRGGVMHCFSSRWETARELLDLGMYISFAGNVTYRSSQDLRNAACNVPEDQILIETDAPYLAPRPLRGSPNAPANVVHTYELLADLRSESTQKLVDSVRNNALRLFQVTHRG